MSLFITVVGTTAISTASATTIKTEETAA